MAYGTVGAVRRGNRIIIEVDLPDEGEASLSGRADNFSDPTEWLSVVSRQRLGPGAAAHDDGATSAASADDLARWRRQLLRIFDQLDGRQGARLPPGARLSSLRESGRIPRSIAALMKAVLEARNATEYEDRELSRPEADAVHSAWRAVREWANEQCLKA